MSLGSPLLFSSIDVIVRVATLIALGFSREGLMVCGRTIRPVLGIGRILGQPIYIVSAMSTFKRSSLALILHTILYTTIDAFRRVSCLNQRFSQLYCFNWMKSTAISAICLKILPQSNLLYMNRPLYRQVDIWSRKNNLTSVVQTVLLKPIRLPLQLVVSRQHSKGLRLSLSLWESRIRVLSKPKLPHEAIEGFERRLVM